MPNPSRTLSLTIACSPSRVYEFVSNPETLPRWATAFIQSARKEDGEWIIETPMGAMKLRFAERNDFGVLDHFVTVEPGIEVCSPMRVIPNGSGSEVLFTLFQTPDMTQERFAEDLSMVKRDLETLRQVLETG